MENKKYELITNDTIKINNMTLYRIKALKDFNNVKKGDLGGYIEKEDNLSHIGNCWVYDGAKVYGNAKVFGNAMVCGDAMVCGNARVCDDAEVCGNAIVCGNAMVYGNASVYGNAKVFGKSMVYDNANVYGNTIVCGNAMVCGNANISNTNDYIILQGFGSKNRTTTFFKCKDNLIRVICGCFEGTIDEFVSKVKETHGNNKYAREYLAIIDLAKIHFDL